MTSTNEPSDRPTTKLPPFEVNVVPVGHIRTTDLSALIAMFRQGSTEPLFIGENGRPEAVVIPFTQFLRLAGRDHADFVRQETSFTDEVNRRTNDTQPNLSLEEFVVLTGETFASLLDEGDTHD